MRFKQFFALLGFALLCGLSLPAKATNCRAADAKRLNGAYRSADGKLLSVQSAGPNGERRITHFSSGQSHRLLPKNDVKFESGADMDSAQPVRFAYEFDLGQSGASQALRISEGERTVLTASKLALRETTATFRSSGIELFGKLSLPSSGMGPFKTVVFVHGSDPVPSVDQEWLPHLLAANGVATFVFDKRGAGCSKGQYVQHFGVLAGDVNAAVAWLKTRPEVDGQRIGLAGFSQGGWVAPLAALQEPSLRFVAVGYGLAMSMADEDRLEAPLKLKATGASDAAIAELQELNAVLHSTAKEGFKDWRALDAALEKFKDRPWLEAVKPMQTWMSVMLQMGIAQAKVAAPAMFEHFFQPFYEPMPTLEKLNIPMLWMIAGQDIEAPPEITVERLQKLREQGKPFSTQIFPNADHGMHEFEMKNGQRVRTKFAEGYFSNLLSWIHLVPQ